MNVHLLARKRAQAVKEKILSLWDGGNHNKTHIGKKVKRSRAYVWEVLLKAKRIKKQNL